jgi:plastocyanin
LNPASITTTIHDGDLEYGRRARCRSQGRAEFSAGDGGRDLGQGAISNLPSATTNRIPPKHDDFATEFLAINPGSVSWHNFDTDPHFVALVPGWSAASSASQAEINPTDVGVNRISGTDDVPGGDTIAVIFSKPGLYYYYCVNHAKIDAATHRAAAFKLASEYPIPMEGFILVTGG